MASDAIMPRGLQPQEPETEIVVTAVGSDQEDEDKDEVFNISRMVPDVRVPIETRHNRPNTDFWDSARIDSE